MESERILCVDGPLAGEWVTVKKGEQYLNALDLPGHPYVDPDPDPYPRELPLDIVTYSRYTVWFDPSSLSQQYMVAIVNGTRVDHPGDIFATQMPKVVRTMTLEALQHFGPNYPPEKS